MYYFENINNVSVLKRLPKCYRFPISTEIEPLFNTDDECISQTIRYYQGTLEKSSRAIEYLKLRGIYDVQLINHFSLGFADRTLGLMLKKFGYIQEEKIRGSLQCSGLIKPSGHEFFRGAIIFPFVDESNNVTGSYGRRITTKLRAGSVYHLHWLSEEITFFNLPVLLQHKTIILCKNPVDALSAYCLGYYNVISLMGAQSFDDKHIEKLKQHNVSTILLACGGNIYTRRIKTKLKQAGIIAHILKLPQGLDMNQCLLSSTVPKSFLSSLINRTQLH